MHRKSDTKEHEKFCQKDGWEFTSGGSHKVYRKKDSDGFVRRTVVSHSYKEYSTGFFKKICKEQLKVSEEYYFSILGKNK